MSLVRVRGIGAVSPAGWGVPALCSSIKNATEFSGKPLVRPGWEKPLKIKPVPVNPDHPAFLAHPRLRRAGKLTHYTVAAALEALGEDTAAVQRGELRLGLVMCVMAGNVMYSRRFYEEILSDPATASPLIFPETVFNAPGSHLSAYLGATGASLTLVGDEGTFLQGLALAANWLTHGEADICLVIGVEEVDWIVGDALRLFNPKSIQAEGAGAICLSANTSGRDLVELGGVTDSFIFSDKTTRLSATKKMRTQLAGSNAGEILYPSIQGHTASDRAELAAWSDWQGAWQPTKTLFGQAFNASSAWQCVAACETVFGNQYPAANVSVVGTNQQAIGARFVKAGKN